MTFSLDEVFIIIAGMFTVCCTTAGVLVFMYSKFITRTEGAKLEEAVQGFIEAFKKVLDEKFKAVHAELDYLKKDRRFKVVTRMSRKRAG